jgi:hypothetical protein
VGALFASGLIVVRPEAFDDNLWAACDCVLGRGENLEMPTAKIYPKRVYEAIEGVRERSWDWLRPRPQIREKLLRRRCPEMTRCLKRIDACNCGKISTAPTCRWIITLLVERQAQHDGHADRRLRRRQV